MSKSKVNLIKHPQYVKIFEETGDEELPAICFFATHTCALGQMSIGDYHTCEQIKSCIDWIKKNSKSKNWDVKDRSGGEMGIYVVCCPFEPNLRQNLRKLKFKSVFNFERRKGYNPGVLEMWTLNL